MMLIMPGLLGPIFIMLEVLNHPSYVILPYIMNYLFSPNIFSNDIPVCYLVCPKLCLLVFFFLRSCQVGIRSYRMVLYAFE